MTPRLLLALLGLSACDGRDPALPNCPAADAATGPARASFYVLPGFADEARQALDGSLQQGPVGPELAGVLSFADGFGVDNLDLSVPFLAGYPWAPAPAPTATVHGNQTVAVMNIELRGGNTVLWNALGERAQQAGANGIVHRRSATGRIDCGWRQSTNTTACLITGAVNVYMH
jgi:hypothetical protein